MGRFRKTHNKQVSIVDIAKDTRLSTATVSRALNNSSRVRENTKQLIYESAKKLNYIPNIGAKALVQGTTNTMGLLFSHQSPLNNMISSLISQELVHTDYDLIVYNANNSVNLQEYYLKDLVQRRVMGLMVLPIPGDYSALEYALNAKVPVLVINRFVHEYPVSHVQFDFRVGITQAMNHLIEKQGRKRIFQLARKDIAIGLERRKVFLASLEAHDLMPENYNPVYPVEDSYQSGFEMMNKILLAHRNVEAVVCSSDDSAVGAIRALKDRNIKIPRQVAVVGSYDTPLSDYYDPRISTVGADVSTFARTAVGTIQELIRDGAAAKPKNISLSTRFINKETT